MGRNPLETIMGAVVLVIAALFLTFAWRTADLGAVVGYPVEAHFSKVGGLTVGSDVRVSGIKVGTVTRQYLDPVTFQAVVHMSLLNDLSLPTDTVATIASDGFLGGKYVKLEPGQAAERLAAGDRIRNTRNYQSVEDMVGEIIFLATQAPAGPPPGGSAPPSLPSFD